MKLIFRIFSYNSYSLTVDEAVKCQRSLQFSYFFYQLIHLFIYKRDIIQSVNISVIFKEYTCPVFYKFFFSIIFKYFLFPAIVLQQGNDCIFKVCFFCKIIHITPVKFYNKTKYPSCLHSIKSHIYS